MERPIGPCQCCPSSVTAGPDQRQGRSGPPRWPARPARTILRLVGPAGGRVQTAAPGSPGSRLRSLESRMSTDANPRPDPSRWRTILARPATPAGRVPRFAREVPAIRPARPASPSTARTSPDSTPTPGSTSSRTPTASSRVQDGMIQVSGQEFGGLATRESFAELPPDRRVEMGRADLAPPAVSGEEFGGHGPLRRARRRRLRQLDGLDRMPDHRRRERRPDRRPRQGQAPRA